MASLKSLQEIPLDLILINTPEYIYWKNVDSVYLGCNKNFARMAGLQQPKDILGKTDYDLPWTNKNYAELYLQEDGYIVQTGHAIHKNEILLETPQNEEILLSLTKKPLFNEQGKIIGILGIYMDITLRKKMEELQQAKLTAEAANVAKTEFIANMSHDIRTPLTGVISMARILEERKQDPEEKQYAHWLHESGEQLLDLLNGVLDVISAGNLTEQDVHEEHFSLRENLRAIERLEVPAIKAKDLELRVQVDEGIPDNIISDRIKLHRTLLNLLGNAIKFTKKGHIILSVKLVELRGKDVKIEFRVADTGIGIPPELQDKIFDPFYRVNPTYKGIYRGHGLGLHIAQRYVALLGGEIQMKSKLGQGTVFFFTLTLKLAEPLAVTHQKTRESALDKMELIAEKKIKSNKTPRDLPTKEMPHLLLVEDNFMGLKAIEMLVVQLGYRFTSAMNAEQAFALIKKTDFDLVLTDIGLPDNSGIDLTRQIREWERNLSNKIIPIIGLTAHAENQVKTECLDSGINEVLSKPASLEVIRMVLAKFLKNKF